MSDLAEFLRLSDRAEFLLARIAEDEAAANGILGTRPAPVEPRPAAVRLLNQLGEKLLAECEAKRRIVEDITANYLDHAGGIESTDDLAGRVLEYLALPYADHPDFRPEWRA